MIFFLIWITSLIIVSVLANYSKVSDIMLVLAVWLIGVAVGLDKLEKSDGEEN